MKYCKISLFFIVLNFIQFNASDSNVTEQKTTTVKTILDLSDVQMMTSLEGRYNHFLETQQHYQNYLQLIEKPRRWFFFNAHNSKDKIKEKQFFVHTFSATLLWPMNKKCCLEQSRVETLEKIFQDSGRSLYGKNHNGNIDDDISTLFQVTQDEIDTMKSTLRQPLYQWEHDLHPVAVNPVHSREQDNH